MSEHPINHWGGNGKKYTEPLKIQIRLPPELAAKELRDAIAIALFSIIVGCKPQKVPELTSLINSRLTLSPHAQESLDVLIPELYPNRNEAVIAALAWLAEQPKHVLNVRI
jgi:hypothetical protein